MLDVERWAEIRRMHFVEQRSIREIARSTGHDRKTVQRALRSDAPPRYTRPARGSKLDPFRDEIERLLEADPRLPGTRIRELLAELGYEGGKTILDDCLRELRPRYLPRPRTFQRTDYRPGEILQFDLFELRREVPVGHGQTRKGWVVLAELGYSRALAGTAIFSKEAPDILWASLAPSPGWAGCRSCSSQTARARCTRAAAGPRSRSRASAASCAAAG